MSKKQKRITLLAGLGVVFLYIIYISNRPSEIAQVVSSADEKFRPIAVENPALKLELLERLKKLQYEGSHRNIFSSVAPPPASAAVPPPVTPPPIAPAGPSGPAP